jgi:hypothetical protein
MNTTQKRTSLKWSAHRVLDAKRTLYFKINVSAVYPKHLCKYISYWPVKRGVVNVTDRVWLGL